MISNSELPSFFQHFSLIVDPRIDRTKKHPLETILFIAISAVIAGAEGYNDIEEFGRDRKDWFAKYVDISQGIPSHDTFARVLSLIDYDQFQAGFQKWALSLQIVSQGQLISIDGKTVRRSHGSGHQALHLVQAWAGENHLMLGQVKTKDHSNEIPAIKELLKLLSLKDAIVSIDAMGTQKDIAEIIQDKKADYVLALKGNQGVLHDEVKTYWNDDALRSQGDYYETTEKDHGRIEIRKYWSTSKIQWMKKAREDWSGLRSIAVVESHRTVKETTRVERRYYISSLKSDSKEIARCIRGHWSIENGLHWVLDIAFREDESRIRKGHAPANFSLLRRMALMLLKKETTAKVGIKIKRLKAGWATSYLESVLFNKI